MPVLPRGGGSSQCGQTVNRALVIDNSKYLNRIVDVDLEERCSTVEPGIVLDELNAFLRSKGLWFPVDVSTSSRATLGGMAGNNSAGSRSIRYGMMRDNVISLAATLADGTDKTFGRIDPVPERTGSVDDLAGKLISLGRREESEIRQRFPNVMRRVDV